MRRATTIHIRTCQYFFNFYPRSPCGERPPNMIRQPAIGRFLSTLSLRRATKITITVDEGTLISIHALLAESDRRNQHHWTQKDISIHALLAESDYDASALMKCQIKFLSTLSLRRATANAVDQILPGHISIHALLAESDSPPSITPTASRNFYPRSPCGERPTKKKDQPGKSNISIHALLAESDVLQS